MKSRQMGCPGRANKRADAQRLPTVPVPLHISGRAVPDAWMKLCTLVLLIAVATAYAGYYGGYGHGYGHGGYSHAITHHYDNQRAHYGYGGYGHGYGGYGGYGGHGYGHGFYG
ncbi:uncharacterized protein LOC142563861 isoform X2 [Dermacentor variabilis]|uniref:uncharacterized protein LOC142563861 isoform X2 n=1 Tax=Dermacentor variabilis TaxID=34621 RepID=UPI003F5C4A02